MPDKTEFNEAGELTNQDIARRGLRKSFREAGRLTNQDVARMTSARKKTARTSARGYNNTRTKGR